MIRLLSAIVVFAAAMSASAEEIVVKAAKVYTLTGDPLSPGAVRIKDGKIAEVAGSIAVPAGAKEIDLGSGVLMPGFIDALSSIAIEGGDAESTREITPNFRVVDAVDWSSRQFDHERAAGVTAMMLVPGSDNVISGLSCVVKTAGKREQRIVAAEHSLMITLASDPASGNSARNRPESIYTRQPTNRMGVVWMLRSEFSRARNSTAKDAEVLRAALDGQRPVVCLSRTDNDILAALRLNKDFPVRLTLAGVQEGYRVATEVAADKVPVLLEPITTTPGAGPEGTDQVLNQAGPLYEAGIAVALTGGHLLEQAQWSVRHGLPRDAALASITRTPAKLLGLESRLGTIAAGRDADLVALSGDPFELSTIIRWTMIDGNLSAEER